MATRLIYHCRNSHQTVIHNWQIIIIIIIIKKEKKNDKIKAMLNDKSRYRGTLPT